MKLQDMFNVKVNSSSVKNNFILIENYEEMSKKCSVASN